MTVYNRGYVAKCDRCGDEQRDDGGCRTKGQATRHARLTGWLSLLSHYIFCSTTCLAEWIDEKQGNVDWPQSTVDDARELLQSGLDTAVRKRG